MTAAATESFAAGGPVLIGSGAERPAFVAAAAELINAAGLEHVHGLGGGTVVLALGAAVVDRLGLEPALTRDRAFSGLPFTASIDAVRVAADGWSLRHRALTMRVAAEPSSGPSDLRSPGHVHSVRIADDHLMRHGGAVAASLELARTAGLRDAVVLCAVLDRTGEQVSLPESLANRPLDRLPRAATDELRAQARTRAANALAVECELPTRLGRFRAMAHAESDSAAPMLALVHGDPRPEARTPVYIHSGCLFGDVFGSLLCSCRAALDQAVADITAAGAGVVLYAKPDLASAFTCRRGQPVNARLAAGLLARLGLVRVRLPGASPTFAAELRVFGLDVEHDERLIRAG